MSSPECAVVQMGSYGAYEKTKARDYQKIFLAVTGYLMTAITHAGANNVNEAKPRCTLRGFILMIPPKFFPKIKYRDHDDRLLCNLFPKYDENILQKEEDFPISRGAPTALRKKSRK